MNLKGILNNVAIYDIETSANYSDGKEVNIRTNFEDYLSLAQVKWVGIYSYKNNKGYYLEVKKDRELIKKLMAEHQVLVSFNGDQFDYPIMVNNGLVDGTKWVNQIDCMKVLGSARFIDKNGNSFKGRGELMGYKFKSNSLKCVAETMNLEFQKSDIDYKIFQKNTYTEKEREEVIGYLKDDIMSTKGMFDKLFDYWKPFTDLIDWKDVTNFSWIKSSIASLIYKSACHEMGVEPTYGTKGKKEKMGGNVLNPVYEEVKDVWYIDFASLYPHIFCMFNLFSECDEDTPSAWHGNDIFKVRGYYDISHEHPLVKIVKKRLLERRELKKNDPDNPMIYTIKIWLNALYGVSRSSVFEKVHTKNCGWDCCWLGQQLQKFVQDEFEKYGIETVYGDTDSCFIKCSEKKHYDKDFIKICLKKIIQKIFDNVPFPVDTFNMDIETFIEYILFPFAEEPLVEEETRKLLLKGDVEGYEKKEIDKKKVIINTNTNEIIKQGRSWIKKRTGKKKNYLYISKKDDINTINIVGLPIKKDNATPLAIKIFKEVLEPKILEQMHGKFDKQFIDDTINEYLKHKEIMELVAIEYKVKPYDTYAKPESQIQAQISKHYFGKGEGVIKLIKNNKIGEVGKTNHYCKISEAIENKLTINDLILEKVYNELDVFIKHKEE